MFDNGVQDDIGEGSLAEDVLLVQEIESAVPDHAREPAKEAAGSREVVLNEPCSCGLACTLQPEATANSSAAPGSQEIPAGGSSGRLVKRRRQLSKEQIRAAMETAAPKSAATGKPPAADGGKDALAALANVSTLNGVRCCCSIPTHDGLTVNLCFL